jgi:predicted outer membrane repeat protein
MVFANASTMSDNSAAGNGGGLFNNRAGVAVIMAGDFQRNRAAGDGGGVWNGGQLFDSGSTFANNTAGGNGGGLFNARRGRALLTHSTFRGNKARHRGGAIAGQGHLVLIDVDFINNRPGTSRR